MKIANHGDDCWALLAALRSPDLAVRGVSTVFDNLPEDRTHAVAEDVLHRAATNTHSAAPPQVYSGASRAGAPAWAEIPASTALARALEEEPLTILALGPLTNIATVLTRYPDLVSRIERVILVGGKLPGELLHPGTQWWFHFRDLNVSKDTEAMRKLLYSGVPLVLIPFNVAQHISITQHDLDRLVSMDATTRRLAEQSRAWLDFWQQVLHRNGFCPIDLLATGYVISPETFTCSVQPVRMGFSVFLAPFGMGRDLEVGADLEGPRVLYCTQVESGIKPLLWDQLNHRKKDNSRLSRLSLNR